VFVLAASVGLVACGSGAESSSQPAPRPAFISDASILDGVTPTVEPIEFVARGEVTLIKNTSGEVVIAEVVVLDDDNEPLREAPSRRDTQLSDGTPVAIHARLDPTELLRIQYSGSTGASIDLASFEAPADELVAIANTLKIDDDGGITTAVDNLTFVAQAHLPLYTGGFHTSYSFGDDGQVDITSFVGDKDELAILEFGPHEPAVIGATELLFYDRGDGNGSYIIEWDDNTLIELDVFVRPGIATPEDIAPLVNGLRPTKS